MNHSSRFPSPPSPSLSLSLPPSLPPLPLSLSPSLSLSLSLLPPSPCPSPSLPLPLPPSPLPPSLSLSLSLSTKLTNCLIGDSQETPFDVVLLATGYKVSFPFISQSLIPTHNNRVELYKHVFASQLSHPHTLAFIGLIQPLGALLPISEMQCRWFAQLMARKRSLPDRQTMRADIDSQAKKK